MAVVRTKMDTSVRRGAIVKSMCLCTRHRFYRAFKPLVTLALDEYFTVCEQFPLVEDDPKNLAEAEGRRRAVLAQLLDTVNSLHLPLPQWSLLERDFVRATRLRSLQQEEEAVVVVHAKHKLNRVSMRIPAFMEDDAVLEASLTMLLATFQHGVLTLFNALL